MFKFNKNPLGGDEFKKRLRSAARILVSDSIVRSHAVFDALADVITEAKPFTQYNVILGQAAVRTPDAEVWAKMKTGGVLRCAADGRPMISPLSPVATASKLRAENLKGTILLVTADDREGEEFVRLTYESNFINELFAIKFDGSAQEIVCQPPKENLKFDIVSAQEFDELRVTFGTLLFGTHVRYAFDASSPKTLCKKSTEGGAFVYTLDIDKYDLYDCDKLVFTAKYKGAEISSAPYSFVFDKQQYWKLAVMGDRLAVGMAGPRTVAAGTPAGGASGATPRPASAPASHVATPRPASAPTATPVSPRATVVRPVAPARPMPLPNAPVAVSPEAFKPSAASAAGVAASVPATVSADEKYQYVTGSTKLPSDKLIDVKVPDKGVLNVKDKDGKAVKVYLDKLKGKGGEGAVYETDRSGVVAKILNNDIGKNRTVNKRNKIELMQSKNFRNPFVAWPISAIYDRSGTFLGFLMPEVRGMHLKKTYNDANKEMRLVDMTRTQIVSLMVKILEIFVYLHDRNIIVGDIKEENIVLKPDGKGGFDPYFVDCDSYQIYPYPATKVSEGFVPPELCTGIDVSTVYRTFGNEEFALFSLLFSILHKGVRPYSQRQTDKYTYGDDELIPLVKGWFPYSEDMNEVQKRAPFAALGNWAHLPSYIKKAFISVGREGGKNFGEKNRLSAKQWLKLFRQYAKDLAPGGRLRAADSECDSGMFMPRPAGKGMDFRVIDFKKVDLPFTGVEGGVACAYTVEDAVRKLCLIAGEALPVVRIASDLRSTGKAVFNSYTFKYVKDTGLVKKIAMTSA